MCEYDNEMVNEAKRKVYLIVDIVNGDIITSNSFPLSNKRVEESSRVVSTGFTITIIIYWLEIISKLFPFQIHLSPGNQCCSKSLVNLVIK